MYNDYFRTEVGGGAVHLDSKMIQSNNWVQFREYLSLDSALESAGMGAEIQHENFPGKNRVWSFIKGKLYETAIGGNGIIIPIFAVNMRYLSPKWYIVKSATDPENDSTDESHDPAIDLPEPCCGF